MKKFDYITRSVVTNLEKVLREYGTYGWELVCVSNGIAYFKKEIEVNQLLNEEDAFPLTPYSS